MAEKNSTTLPLPTTPRSYSSDYTGWAEDTANAVEEGRFEDIDRLALADEVRDLSKSERRGLRGALAVLLVHLLKTEYQPEKQTPILEYLEESPSLRPDLPQLLEKAYTRARIQAAQETGLELELFPASCQWTLAEVPAHPGASKGE
jgi:hypothetical protein